MGLILFISMVFWRCVPIGARPVFCTWSGRGCVKIRRRDSNDLGQGQACG